MNENTESKENKVVVYEKKAPWSLEPKSLDEAIRYSEIMSKSDLVPDGYKGKPSNILIAVQLGSEIGISPMQAIQNIAVINGKPGIYGDLGKALILSAGFSIDEDDIEKVKANKRARCKITRPDGRCAERTFSVEDATLAGLWGKAIWLKNPWRMLAWRAFWFCARDIAADKLKGLGGAEELQDYDVVPSKKIEMPQEVKKEGTESVREAVVVHAESVKRDNSFLPVPNELKTSFSGEKIKIEIASAKDSVRKIENGKYEVVDVSGNIYHVESENEPATRQLALDLYAKKGNEVEVYVVKVENGISKIVGLVK